MSFLDKLIPNSTLKRLRDAVFLVNAEEEVVKVLTGEELVRDSKELKKKVVEAGGTAEALDAVLPRAFALVRESARRNLKQRHFDAQLIGGMVLHEGKIAEMLTGEGKTLAATLPAYLNALTGRGVHVVTVNDYLARRDAVWMGQIYDALGLSVSCIVHDSAYRYDATFTKESQEQEAGGEKPETGEENLDAERDAFGSFKVFEEFLRPIARKEAYACDITYGTNHEFGFDYLRDNLSLRLSDKVQRPPYYAIIDEVDSILIDEARTPLIIAAPDSASSGFYKTFAHVAEHLVPEEDYTVDEKLKAVSITEPGITKVEKMLNVGNIFDPENSRLVHYLNESLKAKALFRKDKEYVVKGGEVFIVDEFTGRVLQGRRYSGGLHQAIEAKEGVEVRQENRTYAQITIQNYFRLYGKIAGMTGTAQTSAEEFHKVYGLDVVSIPPNRPMVRNDASDAIYKTKQAKYEAVVREVRELHEKGQPILLGTTSISNNEIISGYLTRASIPHEVLNAKNNDREGAIIAQAGKRGAVTVATNMAGRGVDIVLGGNPSTKEEAAVIRELGGLHVIGTERHEARRIDNQLRGRSGRQGDPGSTRFFLSLEDDLMRIFGGDRIGRIMNTLNFPEDVPIESKMVTKSVNQAQEKVEGSNFDIRKHLLEFDDVLNKQRTAIYRRRAALLESGEKGEVRPLLVEALEAFVASQTALLGDSEEDMKKREEFEKKIATVPETLEPSRSLMLSQHFVRIWDALWVDHLENLEGLRESVNIRAYGQHEPLVEYRHDAHKLFQDLEQNVRTLLWNTIFPLFEVDMAKMEARATQQRAAPPPEAKDIGRNDPCWCGSGKKFKKCHGA
jgi:preprotein translocase subunit SecA